MITVLLRALARGKLITLAVVATLIVVAASAAVAHNPPMGVDSSTNVDEVDAHQQLDAANSSEIFSQAIYTEQRTSTGRNLERDDLEGDGRQVAAAACDEGDVVLSGGHFKVDKGTTLVASGPNPRHNSWRLEWISDETEDSIGVKVLCADLGTPHTVPSPEAAVPRQRLLRPQLLPQLPLRQASLLRLLLRQPPLRQRLLHLPLPSQAPPRLASLRQQLLRQFSLRPSPSR